MRRDIPPPQAASGVGNDLHAIGEAAALSGVSAKMIRHYESIGLIPPAARTTAGYRLYADADIHRLRFIRRARALGFPMKQVGHLLALWSDRSRASAEVKRLATAQADALAVRIAEMQAMQRTLQALASRCHGDDRPECPILDDLGSEGRQSRRDGGDPPLR